MDFWKPMFRANHGATRRQMACDRRPRTPAADGSEGDTRHASFSGVTSCSSYPPGAAGGGGAFGTARSSDVSASL